MTEPLYDFQNMAVSRIEKGNRVYLGFDPGLGKSRTALEAAHRRGAKRILVICPASGRYVWEEQTRLWSPYKSTIVWHPKQLAGNGVKILTYGLISNDTKGLVDAVVRGDDFDMGVLDEAAALKNPGSNRTKAVLGRILPKLHYALPLSGTPAPNHAGELYSVLKALYPQALVNGGGGVLTQWQFEDRYCNVKLKKFGNSRPVRVIEGSRNLAELRNRISPFMLRVRKEMVLKDLPPVRYDIVPIGVDPGSAAKLPTLPDFADDDEALRYLSRGNVDEHLMKIRRTLGVMKVNPACEFLDDFMQALPAHRKALVFAHHRDVIASLMHGLASYKPVKVDGSTAPAERTKAINTFLTDSSCRLFIANIAAAGTGITLVGPTCHCSDVFFVEASYSVGDNVQAAARVHRIGQHDAVIARFLTAHGTIDDRIQDILARKARDFQQLFN